MSYLHERVFKEMDITPEQQKIVVRVTSPENFMEREVISDIFTSDDNDNIKILVYTINRNIIEYDHVDSDPFHQNINNNRTRTFYLTRKNPANLKPGENKYLIPKGAGTYPFFPPALIEKYEKRENIKTLILTEGYFKAFKASVHGFDVVGLSSITHYADSKVKTLYPDILKLILKCEVRNVIMLYDGDCFNISQKNLEEKTELTTRPNKFYQAMLKVRQLLSDLDVQVYFAHVKSEELKDNPKGLDDVLIANKGKEEEIWEDLMRLSVSGEYFYKLNVSAFPKKLQPCFNLHKVEKFYDAHEKLIGEEEFVFNGSNYKFLDGVIERTVPAELKNYMRVGDEYFELIKIPNIRTSETTEIRVRRKKTTIQDDFPKMKDVIQKIQKYKSFINYPSNTDYKQVINNCYNVYYPIDHEPEPGEWNHIDELMHHIFGEQYEFGLDYVQLLYQQPLHILPILCLVSKENETGKTSFLDFLTMIFKENSIIVGNSEIQSDFNSMISGKLLVAIDETSLEDSSKITEKIKMLSTSKQATVTSKGVDSSKIENFTKYAFCSNNETRFIYTSQTEERFWVRKIPQLTRKNPDFLTLIKDEIPAFLYFLNNRKIHSKRVSRMWFDPKDLVTEALLKLREQQKPKCQQIIEEFIHDMLIDSNKPILQYTEAELVEFCPRLKKYEEKLRYYLKEILQLEKAKDRRGVENPVRYDIYYHSKQFEGLEENTVIAQKKGRGRPWVFPEEKFLSKSEIEDRKYYVQTKIEFNNEKEEK